MDLEDKSKDTDEYLESMKFIGDSRWKLLDITTTRDVRLSGLWTEFGVYRGLTARYILQRLPKNTEFHLFDSFDGLPKDWNFDTLYEKGKFRTSIPRFGSKRVHIHKGLYIMRFFLNGRRH